MSAIFFKEIQRFFSSLVAYLTIAVFLLITGLFIWVFPDYSILDYGYASLEQLFEIAPMVFIFLIPAITMRSFSEELQTGTIEFLVTKPLQTKDIVWGKFLACWVLVVLALLPTLVYYLSVYQLGNPIGNIDSGAVWGSYLGLLCLAAVFVAIGIFASSLTSNQIVAFLLASFLCFFAYTGFLYISKLPFFYGKTDTFLQMWGLDFHYRSISRGLIDSRDVIYFLSATVLFVVLTEWSLRKKQV